MKKSVNDLRQRRKLLVHREVIVELTLRQLGDTVRGGSVFEACLTRSDQILCRGATTDA
jgi:hypothetical protein